MSLDPITLVLGGARSGKSAFAESLFAGSHAVYVATAEQFDDEMRERVARHRVRRDSRWRTVEEPLELDRQLPVLTSDGSAVLVDCLTVWLGNLMHAGRDIDRSTAALLESLAAIAGPVAFVSNEVGLGIVPDNAMARAFRDHAGRLNQKLARRADRVIFVAAGIPITLKCP